MPPFVAAPASDLVFEIPSFNPRTCDGVKMHMTWEELQVRIRFNIGFSPLVSVSFLSPGDARSRNRWDSLLLAKILSVQFSDSERFLQSIEHVSAIC